MKKLLSILLMSLLLAGCTKGLPEYRIGPIYADGTCGVQRNTGLDYRNVGYYDNNDRYYWTIFKNVQEAQEYIKSNTIISQ